MDLCMDRITERDFDAFCDLDVTDCHTHVSSVADIFRIAYNENLYRIGQFNVLGTTGAQKRAGNAMVLLYKRLFPGRVFGCAHLQYPAQGVPDDPEEFLRQAKRYKALGFDGMKMLEGKPTGRKHIGVRLDDPIYDAYFGFLEREGFPILYHVGDPKVFWDPEKVPQVAIEHNWAYLDGSFRTKDELYEEVDGFLGKFPKLRVVFAHFFFKDEEGLQEAGAFLDRWPQVSYDLTPGMLFKSFEKDLQGWRDFFIKYQDRILFGTDNDYGMSRQLIYAMRSILESDNTIDCWDERLHGMALEKPILKKIYSGNFARFFGRAPREVTPFDIVDECEHAKTLAGDGQALERNMKDIGEIMAQVRQRWLPEA